MDGWNQAPPSGDQAVTSGRQTPGGARPAARGLQILGGGLEGADTATTLRVREGKTCSADGPFFTTGEYIAAISTWGQLRRPEQAVQLAAAHPAARSHPIEVRPFENE